MREVGRGQKLSEAPPVQGRVVRVDGHRGARPDRVAAGATEGIVVLSDGAPAAVLEPFAGELAAIVCLDDEPEEGFARAGEALGIPCLVGVRFDGDVPADGSLVLVDCAREEDGLVLVVDGGAGDLPATALGSAQQP